jgi:hypothetical protein
VVLLAMAVPQVAVPLEEVVPLAVALVEEPLPLRCRTLRRLSSLLCGITLPRIAIARGTPEVQLAAMVKYNLRLQTLITTMAGQVSNIGHSAQTRTCHLNVILPYFIGILAYFSTYVCILRKIQAPYGCIRILRRIIQNTLTYITYVTAKAYKWLNIRVWTQP